MNRVIAYGIVNYGILTYTNINALANELRKKCEGRRVKITIENVAQTRTPKQNAYLWGVAYPHAVQGFIDAGHEDVDTELIHRFFKRRFLPYVNLQIIDPETGELISLGEKDTTTTLTKKEFSEYTERIIRFCALHLNTIVPPPPQ